jgi:hypothetical protein
MLYGSSFGGQLGGYSKRTSEEIESEKRVLAVLNAFHDSEAGSSLYNFGNLFRAFLREEVAQNGPAGDADGLAEILDLTRAFNSACDSVEGLTQTERLLAISELLRTNTRQCHRAVVEEASKG